MPEAHFDFETPATPDQISKAMLDFSDKRPYWWPNLAAKYYKVHSIAEGTADIQEGSGLPFNIWARERYEWSDPMKIRWTVMESNFCEAGKGVEMTIQPGPNGGSRVHIDWERNPTNLKGRILLKIVGSKNGKMLQKFIRQGIDGLPEKFAKADATTR